MNSFLRQDAIEESHELKSYGIRFIGISRAQGEE